MKTMKYLSIAIAATLLASCTLTRPYTATNNPIGSKVGVSKTTCVFGGSYGRNLSAGLFVTNKNFGVIEAAKNGGIEKVATVDIKTQNLFFIQKVEVIVTGE
jgi:hypothetical protein